MGLRQYTLDRYLRIQTTENNFEIDNDYNQIDNIGICIFLTIYRDSCYSLHLNDNCIVRKYNERIVAFNFSE